MITEKIERMRKLRHQRLMASKVEMEEARPLRTDISEILLIYKRFLEVCDPKCKDNNSIFILLVVFLYSPVSFVRNHISGSGIRKGIANVMGLSCSSVSVYFNNAKSLILNHHGFRKEAERVYSLMAIKPFCELPPRGQDETQ